MAGENGYTIADLGALLMNRDRNDGYGWGFGGNIGWLFIIAFFFLFGGFGGGFGGGWGNNAWANAGIQGTLTRSDLNDGLSNLATHQKLDSLTMEVNNDAHNMETSMITGFNGVNNGLMENRFATQQGFCETNRNIDSVKYENAKNTCDIITAGNANTQRILDTLCEDRIQGLRDKIAEQSQMLQSAAFQVSQEQQNATLINALRPTPIPAYLTASPYQSYAPYGYGNGNGYYGNGYWGYGFGNGGFGPF